MTEMRTRMLPVPSAAAWLDQSAALEQVPHGTRRRPGLRRMPCLEPRQQLVRAPARMLSARLHDGGHHPRVNAMGTLMRGTAPLLQAGRPVLLVSVQPLVARPSTDAVALHSSVMEYSPRS